MKNNENYIELIDYSKINQAISEYADTSVMLCVNNKYSALVKNKNNEYALVSNKYELTTVSINKEDLGDYEGDFDDEFEHEFEVLFDIEDNNKKKYKYTIPLDSILESDKERIKFKDFFRPENTNLQKLFYEWYTKK